MSLTFWETFSNSRKNTSEKQSQRLRKNFNDLKKTLPIFSRCFNSSMCNRKVTTSEDDQLFTLLYAQFDFETNRLSSGLNHNEITT